MIEVGPEAVVTPVSHDGCVRISLVLVVFLRSVFGGSVCRPAGEGMKTVKLVHHDAVLPRA